MGDEYMDYNLIKEHDLSPVVFHSLRHTSVTYKLKLNGGDIKAVQGDSCHSQINMVTDVYSHIIDDDRRKNAELSNPEMATIKDGSLRRLIFVIPIIKKQMGITNARNCAFPQKSFLAQLGIHLTWM